MSYKCKWTANDVQAREREGWKITSGKGDRCLQKKGRKAPGMGMF